MHILLAIQEVLSHGKLLLSDKYVAYPDSDYMDHVDFPPYIYNSLILTLYELLKINNKIELFTSLNLVYVNPLNSSLRYLASYYRGKLMLRPALFNKLHDTILSDLKDLTFLKSSRVAFIFNGLIFVISYFAYQIRKNLTKNFKLRITDDINR